MTTSLKALLYDTKNAQFSQYELAVAPKAAISRRFPGSAQRSTYLGMQSPPDVDGLIREFIEDELDGK